MSDRDRGHLRDAERTDEAGAALVDVTLIDEMSAMTVEERLRQNDRMLRTIDRLRKAQILKSIDGRVD